MNPKLNIYNFQQEDFKQYPFTLQFKFGIKTFSRSLLGTYQ